MKKKKKIINITSQHKKKKTLYKYNKEVVGERECVCVFMGLEKIFFSFFLF